MIPRLLERKHSSAQYEASSIYEQKQRCRVLPKFTHGEECETAVLRVTRNALSSGHALLVGNTIQAELHSLMDIESTLLYISLGRCGLKYCAKRHCCSLRPQSSRTKVKMMDCLSIYLAR